MRVFIPFDESVLDHPKIEMVEGLVPYKLGYRCVSARDLPSGDELETGPEESWLEVVVG